MSIRKPDKCINEQLYSSILTDTEKENFLNEIDTEIYKNALPLDDDSVEMLLVKKKYSPTLCKSF